MAPRFAWCAITEAKQSSRWPVIGWMIKMYYLVRLRASERTFRSRLHLQSLTPTPVSRRVDVRQLVVKIIAESLSHDEKHVVASSLTGIRVGKRKSLVWCPGQNKRIAPLPFFHVLKGD
jgi:hypothetical protein